MINQFIFMGSRKLPQSLRNLLMKGYFFYVKIKHLFQYGGKEMFETINIETSSKCNNKCSYCPNSKYQRKNSLLSIKILDKLFSELREIGFKGDVMFSGYNEPLMDKRIMDIIKRLKKQLPKNKIIIYTNGEFLDYGLFRTLRKKDVEFNITLHKKGIPVGLSEIMKKASSSERKGILIRRNLKKHVLSTRAGLVKVKNPQKKDFCILPYVELTIDYKGNIVLCSDDYFSSVKFGNLKKESIQKIWNKKEYKDIRNDLIKGNVKLDICKECLCR